MEILKQYVLQKRVYYKMDNVITFINGEKESEKLLEYHQTDSYIDNLKKQGYKQGYLDLMNIDIRLRNFKKSFEKEREFYSDALKHYVPDENNKAFMRDYYNNEKSIINYNFVKFTKNYDSLSKEDWVKLSEFIAVPKNVIENFKDSFIEKEWEILLKRCKFDLETIVKFILPNIKSDENFWNILEYQDLKDLNSLYIIKHLTNLNRWQIAAIKYKNVDKYFIDCIFKKGVINANNKKNLNINYFINSFIVYNPKLAEEFIENLYNRNFLITEHTSKNFCDPFICISRHKKLSLEFIKKFKNNINFLELVHSNLYSDGELYSIKRIFI